MSGMRIEVRQVVCPHCHSEVPVDTEKNFPSEEALMLHVEERIEEHLDACVRARPAKATT